LSGAFAVYGTALVLRPLGAPVFGRLGDTRGRRSVLVTVIFLMTGATAGVGFLPGYAAIGLLAPILLMLLRAAQGLAAGGELGAAAVFMFENARSSRRRHGRGRQRPWRSGSERAGSSWDTLLPPRRGRAVVWLVATLLALPLGLIGLHLRRRVAETHQFVVLQTTSRLLDHPARELWQRHKAAVLRGFCLIAAGSLAFNMFFIFMPNNLIARHGAGLSETVALWRWPETAFRDID
jgi:MFS transporter, MHS family, proline/betaine transporter